MAVDASELRKLASDLSNAPKLVRSEARGVIAKAALSIKNQMRDEVARSRHFRFAHTISYDIKGTGDTISAEAGPVAGGVASLAGFAYFGGVNGGGGTVPDPQGALDAEAPNVEKYLTELAEKALL